MGLWRNVWNWLMDAEPASSAVPGPVAVRESFTLPGLGGGADPDLNLTAAQGGSRYFRRLTARVDRDLPTLTDEQARQIAYTLYEQNPIAKRMVELLRDYVLGEGVTITFEREAEDEGDDAPPPPEQAIIDEFWSGPANRLDRKLDKRILELGIAGEQCWTVRPNPANGSVRVGYIDSASISKVIIDPDRPEDAAAIQQKSLTGSTDGPRFKVVRTELDPDSPSYGRMVGVQYGPDGKTVLTTFRRTPDGPEEPYAGACFFWTINNPISSTRGRSDLLTVADIVDAIDKIMVGEMDRQDLMKAFTWDVAINGQPEDVDKRAAQYRNSPPRPGSVLVHTDKEIWSAVSPDLKSYDTARMLDVFYGAGATGIGLPKTWLNETETSNRATAAEISEPAFKRLTKRQGLVREMIVDVVTYVLDTAELAGMIDKRPATKSGIPEAWPLTVTLPELRPKDMTTGTKALADVANAIATLMVDGIIDKRVGQELAAVLIDGLGVDVDMEAMRERLEVEKAERERQQQEMMRTLGTGADGEDGPPTNGNGNGGGNGGGPLRGQMAVLARGGGR